MYKKNKIAALALVTALAATSLSACGASKDAALVKIDGNKDKISYGYAAFTAYYTQAMYELLYGQSTNLDTMWSTDYSGEGKDMEVQVKDQLLDSMKEEYFLAKHAADYKVKITDEEEKKIKETAKAFLDANSDEGIKKLGASQEYVEKMLRDETIRRRMKKAIEAEADSTVTAEEANQKSYSYVKWDTGIKQTEDGSGFAPVSDDEKAEFKAQAEKLSQAADFEAAAGEMILTITNGHFGQSELKDAKADSEKKEGEASSYTGNPYELLSAVDALAEGQISQVIETKDAIYVAKLTSLKDEEATATEMETLEQKKKDDYYKEVLDAYEAESTWVVDEKLWDKVEFIDHFKGTLYDTDTGNEETTEESSENAAE